MIKDMDSIEHEIKKALLLPDFNIFVLDFYTFLIDFL
jgi:hypothetical protein